VLFANSVLILGSQVKSGFLPVAQGGLEKYTQAPPLLPAIRNQLSVYRQRSAENSYVETRVAAPSKCSTSKPLGPLLSEMMVPQISKATTTQLEVKSMSNAPA